MPFSTTTSISHFFTCTHFTSSSISFIAHTGEGSISVMTGGITITVITFTSTFIDVCKIKNNNFFSIQKYFNINHLLLIHLHLIIFANALMKHHFYFSFLYLHTLHQFHYILHCTHRWRIHQCYDRWHYYHSYHFHLHIHGCLQNKNNHFSQFKSILILISYSHSSPFDNFVNVLIQYHFYFSFLYPHILHQFHYILHCTHRWRIHQCYDRWHYHHSYHFHLHIHWCLQNKK